MNQPSGNDVCVDDVNNHTDDRYCIFRNRNIHRDGNDNAADGGGGDDARRNVPT